MSLATAPAKIILLGEHSVVYGEPAIAIPVSSLRANAVVEPVPTGAGLSLVADDLGHVLPIEINSSLADDALVASAQLVLNHFKAVPPDVNIVVRSDIPIASGLGSGAAISTVVVRALSDALGQTLSPEVLNDLVYQVEKIHHGTPSGIDNTVIVYECPIYFVRGKQIEFLRVHGLFSFLIADTGVAALTRMSVSDVSKLYHSDPQHYGSIFTSIGDLVRRARIALETANEVVLGELMRQNHEHLRQLTVSSPELDKLVQVAQDSGALGAKLSGGGRGGNMIALVRTEDSHTIRDALLKAGAVRVLSTVLM